MSGGDAGIVRTALPVDATTAATVITTARRNIAHLRVRLTPRRRVSHGTCGYARGRAAGCQTAWLRFPGRAGVAELVDAAGLGPAGPRGPWRFESSRPHCKAVAAARAAEVIGVPVFLEPQRLRPVDGHPAHRVGCAPAQRHGEERDKDRRS